MKLGLCYLWLTHLLFASLCVATKPGADAWVYSRENARLGFLQDSLSRHYDRGMARELELLEMRLRMRALNSSSQSASASPDMAPPLGGPPGGPAVYAVALGSARVLVDPHLVDEQEGDSDEPGAMPVATPPAVAAPAHVSPAAPVVSSPVPASSLGLPLAGVPPVPATTATAAMARPPVKSSWTKRVMSLWSCCAARSPHDTGEGQ